MIRFLISAPLALMLCLILFYGLAMLTKMSEQPQPEMAFNPNLDFQMIRQESSVQTRRRKLPEPIVAEQQPEIPQTPTTASLSLDTPSLSIDVPDVSASFDVNLSPSLVNVDVANLSPGFVANPKVLNRVSPRYPVRALQRKLEGDVIVEFTIDATGAVVKDSIKVIESTPPGVFDSAVIRSIQGWQFETHLVDGQAVAYQARQALKFRLDN